MSLPPEPAHVAELRSILQRFIAEKAPRAKRRARRVPTAVPASRTSTH
jgi:hypothetical protein